MAQSSATFDDPAIRLYNAEEAGRFLGQHRRTLLDLAAAGKIGHVRLGPRSVRFRHSDLLDYIEAHRRGVA